MSAYKRDTPDEEVTQLCSLAANASLRFAGQEPALRRLACLDKLKLKQQHVASIFEGQTSGSYHAKRALSRQFVVLDESEI